MTLRGTAAGRVDVEPGDLARVRTDRGIDNALFVLAGLAAIWMSYLILRASVVLGWGLLWFAVAYWLMLAYLVLPRLHRILTRIYVPDYFIGRARTSDGLLGDPVNLACLGEEAAIHQAMEAAGWTRADDLSLRTGLRIVRATLSRRSYLQAPVSPLLLFGRIQDFAYQQEVNGSPGKRHHVRFWRCPEDWRLPGGQQADWVAGATYDRRVGLSLFTLQITHKVEADTDVERDHVVDTVRRANPAMDLRVIEDFSTGYHSRNGGGDAIITDGDLPIVDLRRVEVGADHEADVPTDSRDKRPSATIVGSALVLLRGLVAVVFGGTVAVNLDPDAVGTSSGVDASLVTAAAIALVAIVVLFALFEVLLAWRVFLGGNIARLLAMLLSLIAFSTQTVIFVVGGSRPGYAADLPGLAVDVLLLLALSSERARTYAERRRKAPKRISGLPGDVAMV